MGLGDFVKKGIGSALGSSIGGGIGGAIVGNIFGQSDGSRRRENRRNQADILEQITLGNQQDIENQKAMFDHRLNAGFSRGLTPQEMFGSPAAGSGGGTTGSGATLGNQASAQSIASKQLRQQQEMQYQTLGVQAATQLMQTEMQTDAQRDVAKIGAGATVESAEISAAVQQARNLIEQGRLDLDTRNYEEVTLKAAAENLKLTKQQTLKATNEVATSNPKFIRAMKILTMSAENLIATVMVNGQPVDVTDPQQLSKMTVAQKSKLLNGLIAMSSHSFRESSGIGAKASEVFETYLSTLQKNRANLIENEPHNEMTVEELGNARQLKQRNWERANRRYQKSMKPPRGHAGRVR